MSIVNINGRKIDVEGYDTMSPEDQQSAQDEIAGQLGHHDQAAQELNQQQKETAETGWQQNPYIAGPVSAVVDTAKKAYEHPLAAAGVATALGTAASKIPVVGPAVSNALGRVAGAFVPQQVQRAATGLSNLAEGVSNGVNQWGQNVATTAAQKTNTSQLVHYNQIMDRIRMMGDKATPQDKELATHLWGKITAPPTPITTTPITTTPTITTTPITTTPITTTPITTTPTITTTPHPTTAQPGVIQRGMDYANQMRQIAAQKVTSMAPALEGAGQQVANLAQRAAPYINNPLTRGIAKLGGVGPQMATYSGGLNTNEEEELRRRRGMGPTLR